MTLVSFTTLCFWDTLYNTTLFQSKWVGILCSQIKFIHFTGNQYMSVLGHLNHVILWWNECVVTRAVDITWQVILSVLQLYYFQTWTFPVLRRNFHLEIHWSTFKRLFSTKLCKKSVCIQWCSYSLQLHLEFEQIKTKHKETRWFVWVE